MVVPMNEQYIIIDDKKYNVSVFVEQARGLKPFKLNIKGMNISYEAPCSNYLTDFVHHIKRVNDADLSHPIVLSKDGIIADGRHRLCKALLLGNDSILAVQVEEDPFDYVDVDDGQ